MQHDRIATSLSVRFGVFTQTLCCAWSFPAAVASVFCIRQNMAGTAHLLYATPHYRGGLELIEDLVLLFEVPVMLHVPQPIRKATLIPDGVSLPLQQHDGDCEGHRTAFPNALRGRV